MTKQIWTPQAITERDDYPVLRRKIRGELANAASAISLLQDDISKQFKAVKNSIIAASSGYDAPVWSSGTNYSQNNIVQAGGILYISNTNGNLGNIPSTSPTNWAVSAHYLLFQNILAGLNATTAALNALQALLQP